MDLRQILGAVVSVGMLGSAVACSAAPEDAAVDEGSSAARFGDPPQNCAVSTNLAGLSLADQVANGQDITISFTATLAGASRTINASIRPVQPGEGIGDVTPNLLPFSIAEMPGSCRIGHAVPAYFVANSVFPSGGIPAGAYDVGAALRADIRYALLAAVDIGP